MKTTTASQGSAEWFLERSGRVTASSVADAISFLKKGENRGGETAARAAYKARIVAETLTGEPSMEGYLSPYMTWGIEQEGFARAAYEARHDVLVDTVGLVIHPTIERAAASPDGLVEGGGLLELKCPKTDTHLRYMLNGVLPPEYEPQVMWQLACTGLEWADFASFDPRLPERHRLFIVRVPRNAERIAEMERLVLQFLAEVDETIERLNALNPELEKATEAEQDWAEGAMLTAEEIDHYLGEGAQA